MKARFSDFLRFVSLELKGFDVASNGGVKQDERKPPARVSSLHDASDSESSVSSMSLAVGAETLDPGLRVDLNLKNIARSSVDSTDHDKDTCYEAICDAIPQVFGRYPQNMLVHMARLPYYFERLIYHSVVICLDTLLFELTFMPIQAVTTVSHLANRFVTYIAREVRYLLRSGHSKPEASHLDSGRTTHSEKDFHEPTHPHCLGKHSVTLTEVCGCVRFMVLLATIWIFSFIDTSKVYHNIKAQPVMKLYVIFNMLEIFERLCRSFTRDMMDSLTRTTIRIFTPHFVQQEKISEKQAPEQPAAVKKPTPKKKRHWGKKKRPSNESFGSAESALTNSEASDKQTSYAPLDALPVTPNDSVLNSCRKYSEAYNIYYKFAFLYVSVVLTLAFHSFLHLVRVLSLNIAINSPESTMFLLLITNNFAEIKSTVFKKYDDVSLFVIFASDAVERCYLLLDAVLVILKMSTSRRQLRSYVTVFTWLLVVYAFEILIDLMKHGYLVKFNRIRSQTFEKYNWTLVADCLVGRARYNRARLTADKFAVPCEGSFSFSHVSSRWARVMLRRLGFMASPIVTLIVCSLPKLGGCLSAQTFAVAVLTWLSLLALKVSTSVLLTAYSVKNRSRIYALESAYYQIGAL